MHVQAAGPYRIDSMDQSLIGLSLKPNDYIAPMVRLRSVAASITNI